MPFVLSGAVKVRLMGSIFRCAAAPGKACDKAFLICSARICIYKNKKIPVETGIFHLIKICYIITQMLFPMFIHQLKQTITNRENKPVIIWFNFLKDRVINYKLPFKKQLLTAIARKNLF